MARTSMKSLEQDVKALAEAVGRPTEAYTEDSDGKYHAVVGAWKLDSAYGLYRIEQIISEHGAVKTITGFMKAGELAAHIRAMRDGIEYYRQGQDRGRPSPH